MLQKRINLAVSVVKRALAIACIHKFSLAEKNVSESIDDSYANSSREPATSIDKPLSLLLLDSSSLTKRKTIVVDTSSPEVCLRVPPRIQLNTNIYVASAGKNTFVGPGWIRKSRLQGPRDSTELFRHEERCQLYNSQILKRCTLVLKNVQMDTLPHCQKNKSQIPRKPLQKNWSGESHWKLSEQCSPDQNNDWKSVKLRGVFGNYLQAKLACIERFDTHLETSGTMRKEAHDKHES